MNGRCGFVTALCAVLAAGGALAQPSAKPAAPAGPALPGAQSFSDNCQSCHGTTLAGGRGPSLFAESLLASHSDDALRQIIKAGIANSEMPSFAGRLSDDDISQVIAYLHIRGGQLKADPPFVPDPN